MKKTDIKSVGIIGDGKMGRSIFNLLSGLSFHLVWVNISQAERDSRKFEKKITRLHNAGILNDDEAQKKRHSTTITPELDALAACDLVIETITENLELKNALLQSLGGVLSPDALLLTNSSSLHPDVFDLPTLFNGRFAGLHFFYPAETSAIVEIIPASDINPACIETLKEFSEAIGKHFLLQNKRTAFAANRFLLDVQAGFFNHCIEKNIPFALADSIVREKMFANGIFLLMDYVGFDLLVYAIENYIQISAKHAHAVALLQFLKSHANSGHKGEITGQGFYTHPIGEIIPSCGYADEIITVLKNLFRNFATIYITEEYFSDKEVRMLISTFTDPLFEPLDE